MRPRLEAMCFVAFAALIVSRKPDAFLAAQFWAEDGAVWYRQAYDTGWESLLHPQNGYFQTISRIAGNLAQLVELHRAPLVFSLFALAFKLLPVWLLLSARGKALVPSLAARLFLGFLYVAHPYSWEVFVNVTNIHWHLAVAALLVIGFATWDTTPQKVSDIAIVVLCGLSGTFALFLAPISAWRWYATRSRRSLVLAAILFLAACIQVVALALTATETRSPAPLDASWGNLFRIVGGQVAAASILGDGWRHLFDTRAWQLAGLLPFALSAALVVLMGRAFLTGGPALRCFVALSAMVFVAALAQPQISSTQGQWPLFTRPGTGGRYAFIPILAFHVSLVWLAVSDRNVAFRWSARGLLAALLVVGIPASWNVKPYEDVGFPARAREFERAPPGTVVEIPLNPRGWSVKLERK